MHRVLSSFMFHEFNNHMILLENLQMKKPAQDTEMWCHQLQLLLLHIFTMVALRIGQAIEFLLGPRMTPRGK